MEVTIRPLIEEDAYTSVKWHNDPEVFKYTGNTYKNEIKIENELEWIRKVIANPNDYHCAILADGVYVGNIYLTDISEGKAEYHIFIGDKKYWGKGIAKQASLLILDYGFHTLDLKEICLRVRKENISAYHLYLKLGFREGVTEGQWVSMSVKHLKKMIYAPVIIPTLNRYEHFRKCLESLEACTGAEHTDVYVALDYPPSEKYVAGWKKVDAYLHEKEKNNKFKKLTIYRRKTNYFFSGKGNSRTAIEDLPSEIDRYILSEDDNVFSPNFLEYINKGLEKFKDDPKVFYICGYTQPYSFKYGNNTYFFHRTDFSAWGYGTWRNKDKKVRTYIKNKGFPRSFCIANYLKVRKHGLNRLQQYMSFVLQRYEEDIQIRYTDCMVTSYIIINNKYVVNPVISKVRNIGWDSTGCSFMGREKILDNLKEISQRHMTQTIDESPHFDFLGDPTYMMRYNDNLAASVSEGQISWYTYMRSLLFMLLRFVMRKIFGKRFMDKLKKYV